MEIIGTAGDGQEAMEMAHKSHPDIIIMDVNMPVMDGIQATEQLAHELPTSPVIIMSVQGERDYLRRAMQAGAREFLVKPFSHDEMVAAIRRVYQMEQRKGTYLARQEIHPVDAIVARAIEGEVVLVFSGKGGVGASLVAVNLAASLANETNERVALVDLDLQFGDIGVMLNIDHPRTMTDLVEVGETLDAELVNDVLAQGAGGIRVLLAPLSPELADLVTTTHIHAIISELKKQFDYVVVDMASHLAEFNLELIEQAKRILVVTSLTIPAIKDAKLTLKVLDSLNVDPEKILLIANRVDSYSDFNKAAIETNLRFPIQLQLPHEPRVVGDSITRGVPFVLLQPEAEISRAMREFVGKIVPVAAGGRSETEDSEKKKKRGIFSR